MTRTMAELGKRLLEANRVAPSRSASSTDSAVGTRSSPGTAVALNALSFQRITSRTLVSGRYCDDQAAERDCASSAVSSAEKVERITTSKLVIEAERKISTSNHRLPASIYSLPNNKLVVLLVSYGVERMTRTDVDVLSAVCASTKLEARARSPAPTTLTAMKSNRFGCLIVDKNCPTQRACEVSAKTKRIQRYWRAW